MQRINRVAPGLPVSAMQTFSLASPIRTHYRPALCAEVECEAWRGGWATIVDERTDLGLGQAAWIRATYRDRAKPAQVRGDDRWYRERRLEDGRTSFEFEAGQRCFAADSHRVPLERPCLYVVRGGDWRANTGLIRRHVSADDWAEDLHTTTDRLQELHERG